MQNELIPQSMDYPVITVKKQQQEIIYTYIWNIIFFNLEQHKENK